VLAAYAAGASIRKLAVKHGVSDVAVKGLLVRNAVEIRKVRGPTAWNWNGGRHATSAGYIYVRLYPGHRFFHLTRRGLILEHRLIMAQLLGRPLTAREMVHHINGIKDDNRQENLQLHHRNHGSGVVLRCQACGSVDIKPDKIA